jgi:hypothetical protein
MVDRDDVFSAFEAVLIDQGQTNPWITVPGADPAYQPDYGLLELLLRIPIAQGSGSESGRLAKAIDAWVAYELRRSGFPPDEVWPRLTKPRVLPREVGLFVDGLPKRLQGEVRQQLLKNKAVAPSDARVLGLGTFEKVLDMLRKLRAETDIYDATSVVVAEWSDREFDGVTLRRDVVPEDLDVANFMETLIRGTLDRTPFEMHVGVRERREHRVIPLEESDSGEILPKAPGNDADEPA